MSACGVDLVGLNVPLSSKPWLKSSHGCFHSRRQHSCSTTDTIEPSLRDKRPKKSCTAPSNPKQPQTKVAIPRDVPVCRANSCTSQNNQLNFNVHHYARSGRKAIIGPAPVDEFLDEFFPPVPSTRPMPRSLGAFSRVPRNPKDDTAIAGSLVDAINRGKRCPSVKFYNSASASGHPSFVNFKPSVCGYSQTVIHLTTGGQLQNLGLVELLFLVKDHDPFCDSHSHSESEYKSFFSFENREYETDEDVESGRGERRTLGHCVGLAAEVCLRQHRVFCFSVLVVGTRARIFRWDRAGAIVTKSFDFRNQPELLCKFLWRFHLADPVQRGYDPTVTMASQAEEELFRKLIRKHAVIQLGISEDDPSELDVALSEHYESGKVVKVEVYERDRLDPDFHLVSVPLTCSKSLFGHSTRAYWSVKLTEQNEGTVCFLKDTWREDIDSTGSEGSIYEEMGNARVENICDLILHGDVPSIRALDEHDRPNHQERNAGATIPSQRTRTQEFVYANWVCGCLRKRLAARVSRYTHSRMVLKQAGYSLRTFIGSRELFGAARDALEALDTAYKRCRRVHRDVSLNNIILYRSDPSGPRKGLLVDWEFSSVVDSSGYVADNFRSGTWAFMSGTALYAFRPFRHGIEDDLESLFYVIMYGSLRWLPHGYVDRLGSWMYSFFDEVLPGGPGQSSGGRDKLFEMTCGGSAFLDVFKFENQFVQDWFKFGYRLLETASDLSKNKGQVCLWTAERLRNLTAVVCSGLARTKDTEFDRTEHELEGYLDNEKASRDTEASLLVAARTFHDDHREPGSSQKRPADVAFKDDVQNVNTKAQVTGRRSYKRRRVADRREDSTVAGGKIDNNKRDWKRARDKRGPISKNSANFDANKGSSISRPYRRNNRTRSCSSQATRRSPRLEAKSCPLRSTCSR